MAELATILIVDNDAASRNYLAAMLGKSGYTVLTAALGREGLISAWKDKPALIVLDPALPDLRGLELVNRLRQDRRTAHVPCVALSSLEHPQEMSALLAAGCNEYMIKSGQAISRLLELIPVLLQAETEPKKRGALIIFLSAKGGMGTSSLCANMAMCVGSSKLEARVAVADLVLPVGSLAHIVGYTDRLNLVTAALQGRDQTTAAFFGENLPRVPGWYFNLLAGSPDPEAASRLPAERVNDLLDALLESHDYVFVDLGRSLSRISLPIIQRASAVVLVVGTDLATITLTKSVWDYLKTQGLDPQRLYLFQNRAVGLEGMTKDEIEQVLGLRVQLSMPHMSSNFTVANNRHEPILTKYPGESGTLTLQQAASQLIEICQGTRSREPGWS